MMAKRTMGKSKIGYTNEAVPWYYSFNPGGMGCSGCELLNAGCWAGHGGPTVYGGNNSACHDFAGEDIDEDYDDFPSYIDSESKESHA